MGFKSPSRNDDTFNTRFKPYARASPRAIRPLAARDIEDLELGIELSLRSYYFELERRDYVEPNNYLYVVLTERYQETRMGSAMELDRPITFSGTYGCLDTIMADDEVSTTASDGSTTYVSVRPDPSLSSHPEARRTFRAGRITLLKGRDLSVACRKLRISTCYVIFKQMTHTPKSCASA